MKTYTYGDTLELPGIPGVVWKIHDHRTLDRAGEARETRAYLKPLTIDGEPVHYDSQIKIGRAERSNVQVGLSMGAYDRDTDSYDGTKLHIWAQSSGLNARLTDAQRKLLEGEVANLYFHIPPLSDHEIRQRFIANVGSSGGSVRPNRVLPYSGHTRNHIEAALRPEDRQAALEAAVAEFTKTMRREVGLPS